MYVSLLADRLRLDPLSFIPTQGRLLCPQREAPHDRFTPAPYFPSVVNKRGGSTNEGLHGKGVNAHMPLWIAPKP